MSFKTTLGLLIILLFIGGYAYFVDARKLPDTPTTPPRTVVMPADIDQIVRIEVRYKGGKTAVFKDVNATEKVWRFDDPPNNPEIDQTRMGGMLVLLAGLRAERGLPEDKATGLADYGLDKPVVEVYVKTEDGNQYVVFLGAINPNGTYQYWRTGDSNQVYLIIKDVGEIYAKFVTEPPVLKPESSSGG